MGLALNSQTKNVIYNVYKFFKDRKLDPTSKEHRDDINVYKTVAAAVGVSHRSVMRIVKEANQLQEAYGRVVFEDPMNKKKPEIDVDTAIRAKFSEFIKRKEQPTINKIRIELLEDGVLLCSYDYMKLQLKRLGFKFRPARPRLKQRVVVPSVKTECDEGAGAGSSGGMELELEHVTVKLEPLEPGYHYAEGDVPSLTTMTNDLESNVYIKVEEQEYNDDV